MRVGEEGETELNRQAVSVRCLQRADGQVPTSQDEPGPRGHRRPLVLTPAERLGDTPPGLAAGSRPPGRIYFPAHNGHSFSSEGVGFGPRLSFRRAALRDTDTSDVLARR